jgi:hypothetical protein
MNRKIVAVYQVSGQLEGEFIKNFLEAHDIPTGLAQESAGIAYGLTIGALGTVEVLVPEDFVDKARQLLDDFEKGKINPEVEYEHPTEIIDAE